MTIEEATRAARLRRDLASAEAAVARLRSANRRQAGEILRLRNRIRDIEDTDRPLPRVEGIRDHVCYVLVQAGVADAVIEHATGSSAAEARLRAERYRATREVGRGE